MQDFTNFETFSKFNTTKISNGWKSHREILVVLKCGIVVKKSVVFWLEPLQISI